MNRLQYIRRSFLSAALLLLSSVGLTQQYIYKHYDPKDGLASSTVFQVLQDKDGFMWFATNAGASRFDGENFKTFSTADGLPANGIIRMFEDSRGRIWLAPFRNAICYYYKGKIYNQQNDSMLAKMQFSDFVRTVVENNNQELLLTDSRKIYHIDAAGSVRLIASPVPGDLLVSHLGTSGSGDFFVGIAHHIFSFDGKLFKKYIDLPAVKWMQHLSVQDRMMCWMTGDTLHVRSSFYNTSYTHVVGTVNSMSLVSDSILYLNTIKGTRFFNLLERKIVNTFLPKGNVSGCTTDEEGGYWFTTLNDGVFRLASTALHTITGETAAGQKLGVYDLEKFNGAIWAACDLGHVMKITGETAVPIELHTKGTSFASNLVYRLNAKNNRLAAAVGNYVFVKDGSQPFTPYLGVASNKDLAWKNDHEIVLASSGALYTMQMSSSVHNQIHKAARTTALYLRNDSTWFGTFEGLYLMKPGGTIEHLGNYDSLLRSPVVSIDGGADGTIWVATYGSGLIGVKGTRVTSHFNKHNGMQSDRIHCIAVDSGAIWAATEKHLVKISLDQLGSVTRYSLADELGSDIVNTLLVDSNRLYAGTNKGLTWFDKGETFGSSTCSLRMLGVMVNGRDTALQPRYALAYRNNSIRFDYVGVSMKSAGNMVYHYRLTGLDTGWKTTTQPTLELISLPPGEYSLELFAVNKFGVKSSPYSVKILVATPFWKSNWFVIGIVALIAAAAWFVGTLHNRIVIRRQQLQWMAKQQLLELEQKALRAQMNPHFIFNALQSIQGFILDNDSDAANKYLAQFGNLVRQTLENSFQSAVLLSDEIKYLDTYLQLEQLQSESNFTYHIDTAADVATSEIAIPPMVLQPFVENAVLHGMQFVTKNQGVIRVCFAVDNDMLVCRIEDNGIGRQQSQQLQSNEPSSHRSRGMQLTQERIALINAASDKKITVEVIDKVIATGEASGTDVIVRFPIFTRKDSPLS